MLSVHTALTDLFTSKQSTLKLNLLKGLKCAWMCGCDRRRQTKRTETRGGLTLVWVRGEGVSVKLAVSLP